MDRLNLDTYKYRMRLCDGTEIDNGKLPVYLCFQFLPCTQWLIEQLHIWWCVFREDFDRWNMHTVLLSAPTESPAICMTLCLLYQGNPYMLHRMCYTHLCLLNKVSWNMHIRLAMGPAKANLDVQSTLFVFVSGEVRLCFMPHPILFCWLECVKTNVLLLIIRAILIRGCWHGTEIL